MSIASCLFGHTAVCCWFVWSYSCLWSLLVACLAIQLSVVGLFGRVAVCGHCWLLAWPYSCLLLVCLAVQLSVAIAGCLFGYTAVCCRFVWSCSCLWSLLVACLAIQLFVVGLFSYTTVCCQLCCCHHTSNGSCTPRYNECMIWDGECSRLFCICGGFCRRDHLSAVYRV